jgi:hypothetical protein
MWYTAMAVKITLTRINRPLCERRRVFHVASFVAIFSISSIRSAFLKDLRDNGKPRYVHRIVVI